MRYLGLALFAEGSTDHRFLSPILSRVTEELCLQHSHEVVEIGALLELHSPPKFWERDRTTRIAEAAREARGAFNILFIHTDGAGDSEMARRERIDPAAQRIIEAGVGRWECPVAVVPVRETEAPRCGHVMDGDEVKAIARSREGGLAAQMYAVCSPIPVKLTYRNGDVKVRYLWRFRAPTPAGS